MKEMGVYFLIERVLFVRVEYIFKSFWPFAVCPKDASHLGNVVKDGIGVMT